MNKKFKELVGNTLIFALGSLGSKLIVFLLVPLYTNLMTPSEYGTAELVFTIAQMLFPFVSVVIFESVLRYGLKNELRKEDVLLCAFVVILFGSVLTVLFTPLFRFYPAVSNWKWYICAYVVAYMVTSVELVYLKVRDKNKLFALFSVLQTLILASANILFLAVYKKGIEGYLLSNILSHVGTAVLCALFGGVLKDLFRAKLSFSLLRQMTLYSLPLIVNNISWWLIHSADKIMIEWRLGESELGVYTVATKIPALVNIAAQIFSQAWGISSIKEYDSSNDASFFSSTFKYYTFLVFLACILGITAVKPLMRIYVGKEYFGAWTLVPFLLAGAVFSAVSAYFSRIYSAMHKNKNVMLTTLLAAAVNIAGNFFLIGTAGTYGAAAATAVAYAVMAHIQMADVSRFLKFDKGLPRYFLSCSIIVGQAIAATLDWHIYIVSAATIIAFLCVNYPVIRGVLCGLKKKGKSAEKDTDDRE